MSSPQWENEYISKKKIQSYGKPWMVWSVAVIGGILAYAIYDYHRYEYRIRKYHVVNNKRPNALPNISQNEQLRKIHVSYAVNKDGVSIPESETMVTKEPTKNEDDNNIMSRDSFKDYLVTWIKQTPTDNITCCDIQRLFNIAKANNMWSMTQDELKSMIMSESTTAFGLFDILKLAHIKSVWSDFENNNFKCSHSNDAHSNDAHCDD